MQEESVLQRAIAILHRSSRFLKIPKEDLEDVESVVRLRFLQALSRNVNLANLSEHELQLYLSTMVRRAVADTFHEKYRRQKLSANDFGSYDPGEVDPAFDAVETEIALAQAIGSMPAEEHDLATEIIAAKLSGMSERALAEKLGMPASTVRKVSLRILSRIAASIKPNSV